MLLVVQLVLAHLLTAYFLEVVPKRSRFLALVQATAIRVVILMLCINISIRPDQLLPLILLAVVLASIDVIAQQSIANSWKAFLAIQLLEALVIVAIWSLLDTRDFSRVERVLSSPRAYVIAATCVGAILGGGELVRRVCVEFFAEMKNAPNPGLPNAGKYIGWLERFLIVTFVLSANSEAVGFLIAAKTLVRFPEMQDKTNHFSEYFLVGTLTSVGVALGLASLAKLAI